MSRSRARTLQLLALLGVVWLALPAAGLDVPFLSGRVVDLAGIVPEPAEQRIEEKSRLLEQRTGAQIAVLTVASLEGDSLEDFTIRVVDEWKLGQADQDNGVLIFVAVDERRMRIEVGYGLEGVLTDAMSGRILDGAVAPRFREGDFGGGLERGVDAVIALISGEGEPPPVHERRGDGIPGCFVVFFFLMFFVVLPMLRQRRHYRRGWSSRRGWSGPWVIGGSGLGRGGGFSGGGFGGFSGGGGGFGGGGASGGW